MEKIKQIISVFAVTVIILMGMQNVKAQSNARIENIDFTAEYSKLVVTYDIVNAKSGEIFEIWIKVQTNSGKELIPSSTIGDIGKGVNGGSNKRIVWDVEADNVVLDEEFAVEVFAQSLKSGVKDYTKKKPELKKETKPGGISVGGAMAFSALLPGLGNRIVKGSGAQWLLGVVGYGCIAGSVMLNNSAYNAYEDYKIATTTAERDDLYKQAERKNRTSKVLMGTAIVIWVGDLLWTGLQASSVRKKSKQSNFSLNYSVDPYTQKPFLGISYRF